MRVVWRMLNRDFTDPLRFPDVNLEVNRYSWAAIGGPERASATAYGDAWSLWELLGWLRAPVELEDERGDVVWWGYVAEVTVRVGGIEVGVSLDGMYNRVAVAYSQVAVGESSPGTRATTTWAEDTDSVGAYGTKELLESLGEGTEAQAEGFRDSRLAAKRRPIPTVRAVPGRNSLSASLVARGWYDTLGWQYYANTGTDEVETTTQIDAIVTAEGPFFSDVEIVDASGINSNEYRDGDCRALDAVEDLLMCGGPNGRRLLATVTRNRALQVYEEPELDRSEIRLALNGEGRLTDRWGSQDLAHTCPVGEWCAMRDVVPPALDASLLADPTIFFVERSEYDPQNHELVVEPRDMETPWDVGSVGAG